MDFARFSVDRPVATTMFIAFLVVMGAVAYKDIPVDLFPRVELPFVTILTVYPGASPEEIENLITDPIEEAVSSISGIENMTSNSLEGLSQIAIEFEMEVNQDIAAQDVREKVDMILANLPSQAEKPKILKLDINATAVVETAIFGDRPVGPMTRYIENNIKDRFAQVPGVAEVELIGSREREIKILIDEDRLAAYKLSLLRLNQLISEKSLELPGGRVVRGDREWTVRVAAKFADVEQIKDIEIPTPLGQIIKLSDLASVRDSFEEERQRAYFNGRPAVILAIKKRSDANATEVAKNVRETVEQLKKGLPKDMNMAIVRDRSDFILDSLNEVTSNLTVGIILTSIILLIFLGSLRSTFIAALAMPSSIIATMMLISAWGFTLNMLTMMALAITVGILVNNAIVVLENITRKVDSGMDAREAAVAGTNEIAVAVAGATLTNVVVFVPIAFMAGIVGQFFYSFGMTAAFSTIISLIISFTMTPMLAAMLVKKSESNEEASGPLAWFDAWYKGWENEYKKDIPRVLAHPYMVIAGSMALMIIPVLVGPYVGFEFMAETDQGEFIIKMRRPSGVSIESTAAVCRKVENIISSKVPELVRMVTRVGKIDALMGASEGVELGQVTGYTTHKSKRKRSIRQIIESLRAELATIPGAIFSLEAPGVIGSKGAPLQVEVMGPKLDDVVAFSDKVMKVVENTRGAADLDTTWRSGRPEVEIRPDRIRCERAGVSMAYLARAIRGRYAGLIPVTYREGADEFDVRVQLTGDQRNDIGKVGDLSVILPSGISIPIKSLANVVPSVGPSTIIRKDRKKAVVVTGYNKGRSYGDVLSDVQKGVAALKCPQDVSVRYMGDAKNMRESFTELAQAFFLAVLLTYMLLAGLLESFIYPILILISLPLSFVGILPALLICDMNIAMFPLMAVVMLVGIVVNNGILLVENFRDHRDRGACIRDAVIEAAPERLRPILMTTIAAALAMVPLAFGEGSGGEMRAPMAVVSIGGLLASMILSIFLIPLLYYLWETKVVQKSSSTPPSNSATATLALLFIFVLSSPLSATPLDEPLGESIYDYLSLPPGTGSITTGPTIALSDCVRKALKDNDMIQASLAAIAASKEGRAQARATRFGEFTANISRIRYNDTMAAFAGKDEATASSLVYDLPIFTGGAIKAGIRMANAGVQATEQKSEQMKQDTVFQIVKTYMSLLGTQWLVLLGKEHVKAFDLQLELVQARIDAGAAVDSERLRVEMAREEARERLIRFENGRLRAAAALNLTMASPIEQDHAAVDPEVFRGLEETPSQAFIRARLNHPQLKQALANVRIKAQDLAQAKAKLIPTIGLNVTYGDANPIFAGDDSSTQVLLAAQAPLYKAGSMRAKVRETRQRLKEAQEQAQFAERQIRFEIVQAHLDVNEAWKRIGVTRRAMASATENARITAERYRSGAAIVLELVDAQVSLLSARTSVLNALIDYAVALARYHRASGDVWRFFPKGRRFRFK